MTSFFEIASRGTSNGSNVIANLISFIFIFELPLQH